MAWRRVDGDDGDARAEVWLGVDYAIADQFELYAEASFLDKNDDLDNRSLAGVAIGF